MTHGSPAAAVLPVARSLCWGTREEADRLGVAGRGTRSWAYRWIEEHVKHLAPVGVLADIGGGGIEAELCNLLSAHAERVLVVDQFGEHRSHGNIQEVVVNLEDGLTGFPDCSVNVFVSASSIEHLTTSAQKKIFAEMERVLTPGGVFCGTVSYITRLSDDTIRLLQGDPAFERTGSSVHAAFNAKECLDSACRLQPAFPPASWAQFPGFDGFDEAALLADETLISDFVRSYGTVRLLPEIDALRLAWYEMGLFLRKDL
jgi:SAM-dependent methyltransferase